MKPKIGEYNVPRILVIRRKARRMRGLGDFAGLDFFKGIEALAGGGEGVHEMHALRKLVRRNSLGGWGKYAGVVGNYLQDGRDGLRLRLNLSGWSGKLRNIGEFFARTFTYHTLTHR